MKTLRELIAEFGANGVIRIDDGNGSAGPAWIEWDEDIDAELGNTEMTPVNPDDAAGMDPNDEYDTYGDKTFTILAKYVIGDYSIDELYASEWIIDGEGDNPYCYRIIF